MWQDIVAGAVVVLALAFLLRRWLPARWRRRQSAALLPASDHPASGACGGCASSCPHKCH